jgi:hypothetical protein
MDLREAITNHPSWKHMEEVIHERERICLMETRHSADLNQVNKALGELYAYAFILGKLPERVVEKVEEEQEKIS